MPSTPPPISLSFPLSLSAYPHVVRVSLAQWSLLVEKMVHSRALFDSPIPFCSRKKPLGTRLVILPYMSKQSW